MLRTYVIANSLSVLAAIAMNVISVSTDWFDMDVSEVSERYANLFTPAGYAFSIWSLIYIALIGSCLYQWLRLDKAEVADFIRHTGYWFALANLATCVWIVVWLSDQILLSLILMVFTFVCLLMVFLRNRIALLDPNRWYIAFLWWPLMLYFGWITTALIANVTIYLTSIGWAETVNQEAWTIAILILATLVYLFMVWVRNARLYGSVGVWALVAVYVARSAEGYDTLATTALVCAAVLFAVIGIHAWRNR